MATAHPGFKAVQAKIAKSAGVPMKNAGAILAASSRGASAAAKKAWVTIRAKRTKATEAAKKEKLKAARIAVERKCANARKAGKKASWITRKGKASCKFTKQDMAADVKELISQ